MRTDITKINEHSPDVYKRQILELPEPHNL